MSNILKIIDLTDHAIRRAVFAVLDGPAAEHRANRKGSERLLDHSVGANHPRCGDFGPGLKGQPQSAGGHPIKLSPHHKVTL
jgi:hypothetical protein